MRFTGEKLLATGLAVSAIAAGCGNSDSVELNKDASPQAKAEQIGTALNAGKKITGVTVELDRVLPLSERIDVCGPPSEKIYHPINLGDGNYGYTCAQTRAKGDGYLSGGDEEITVHLVRSSEPLASVADCPDAQEDPRSETVSLEAIDYDKSETGNDAYFIGVNYDEDKDLVQAGIPVIARAQNQDPCGGVG